MALYSTVLSLIFVLSHILLIQHSDIPPLSDLIDISNNHLKEMEDSKVVDPDDEKEVEDPLLDD